MFLKQLTLTNYKNIEASQFDFQAPINCFIGNNGMGKSNILDSIYHLAFTKSYFNPSGVQNIPFGKEFFLIEGKFNNDGKEEKINCSLKKGQKKTVKRNGKVYDKIAEHIGLIRFVIISPADRNLIIEGSNNRRKFIDGVIGQTDKTYLNYLSDYNKILAQRNALLKFFAQNRTFDGETLAIYNHQISELAHPIYEKRKAFMEVFLPIFAKRHLSISNGIEEVDIQYASDLSETKMSDLLVNNLEKDKILQFTSVGTHKDDLDLQISGMPIKKFGSQGQQKTFLIALKLAQFDFIKEKSGMNPIVLLDDIFDKLDQDRVTKTIQLFDYESLGQIFISDTHEDRIKIALEMSSSPYEIFNLN
ncbi:MAG: DNA replication and repair protein RecF [Bacteroidota bacterium]|nr:DNA replication and repair protein RecF [Bacteroidota bacterium]